MSIICNKEKGHRNGFWSIYGPCTALKNAQKVKVHIYIIEFCYYFPMLRIRLHYFVIVH